MCIWNACSSMGNSAKTDDCECHSEKDNIIGFVFMWVSGALGIGVSLMTAAPPQDIQDLVEDIRVPGTRQPHGIADADMAPAPAE